MPFTSQRRVKREYSIASMRTLDLMSESMKCVKVFRRFSFRHLFHYIISYSILYVHFIANSLKSFVSLLVCFIWQFFVLDFRKKKKLQTNNQRINICRLILEVEKKICKMVTVFVELKIMSSELAEPEELTHRPTHSTQDCNRTNCDFF